MPMALPTMFITLDTTETYMVMLVFPMLRHSAARSKCRKKVNKYRIEHVDQGNTGYCCIPSEADHKSIGHAYQHYQQLFQQQWNNHLLNVMIGKGLAAFLQSELWFYDTGHQSTHFFTITLLP